MAARKRELIEPHANDKRYVRRDAKGQFKEGDDVEITVGDARQFAISRKPDREELLRRLRAFRGRLPPDFKFDREEANAR